ncbi:MAG: penicillin-binding protein 1C [Candidatus Aminicenantes bacterium]|nr:MAG: penicillin-binding protein 1C [Candidatus Aminicenantes bacterium]
MKTRILAFIRKRKRLVIMLGILFVILLVGIIYFVSFDPGVFKKNAYSTTFYDREGKPLRTFFSADETYAQTCGLAEVSPHFLRAIVLIEDKKFYRHKGVVLSSLFRALWQNVKGQRIVSGGSTITMQLAKLVYRHQKRTIFNKISEIFSALKFELHLSKAEILEAYINRLPFGNMIYGVKTAARFYFGKDPSQLSLNQALYLALIPKSPSRYNPARRVKALEKRWKTILEIFRDNNHITPDEYQRARGEGIRFRMNQYPFLAPHFIDLVKKRYEGKKIPGLVYTTLDYNVQKELEGITREHLVRLKPYQVKSAAAVVIDNHTHQVIGFMGSPDYFNDELSGYVNLATALRQPGSTLKPFVYGIALENGYTPAFIVPDIRFPSRGGFFPKNHDGREHGPLRLRVALACSYNIPAFYLAMKLKPIRVIQKLNQAGFTYIKNESGFYGETIALGSGEVRLLDLVTAFSAFANKGIIYSPTFIKGEPVPTKRLFAETTAFLIWDILADPSARFASFGYDSSMNLPFPVAIKTGTSKGFRDRWAVGVNSEYTIGVWIGNPDGENMKDTTNVGSVSTMLRDIFLAIQTDWTAGAVEIPAGIVKQAICPLSGELVSENCPDAVEEYFDAQNLPQQTCTWHVRSHEDGEPKVNYPELYKKWAIKNNPDNTVEIEIAQQKRITFPQPGDFFYISDAISPQDQQITFEVMGFEPGETIDYYLDGVLYRRMVYPQFPVWQLEKGDHTLVIKIKEQAIDSISFIVR